MLRRIAVDCVVILKAQPNTDATKVVKALEAAFEEPNPTVQVTETKPENKLDTRMPQPSEARATLKGMKLCGHYAKCAKDSLIAPGCEKGRNCDRLHHEKCLDEPDFRSTWCRCCGANTHTEKECTRPRCRDITATDVTDDALKNEEGEADDEAISTKRDESDSEANEEATLTDKDDIDSDPESQIGTQRSDTNEALEPDAAPQLPTDAVPTYPIDVKQIVERLEKAETGIQNLLEEEQRLKDEAAARLQAAEEDRMLTEKVYAIMKERKSSKHKRDEKDDQLF